MLLINLYHFINNGKIGYEFTYIIDSIIETLSVVKNQLTNWESESNNEVLLNKL